MKQMKYVIIGVLGVMVGYFLYLTAHASEPIAIPKSEGKMTVKLVWKAISNETTIEDPETIEKLIAKLETSRKTQRESINDVPVADDFVKVTFMTKGEDDDTLFVYEAYGKEYAERPYSGIWTVKPGTYSFLRGLSDGRE